MGRMQDALRKAAEERERRRLAETRGAPAPQAIPAPPSAPFEPVPAARPLGVARPPDRRVAVDERLVVFHAPTDVRSEAFRRVRATLLALDPRPRCVLITSGSHGEGKSLTTANLALALLEAGEGEVLVVDANLRHPEMAGLLGVRGEPGLSDVLDGRVSAADAIVRTAIPNLALLPAGQGGIAAARQLHPGVLKEILDPFGDRFEFVLVDTPAAHHYADAVLLSNDVDGVLVAIKVGAGRRAVTKKAIDDLEAAKARLLGTVVLTES